MKNILIISGIISMDKVYFNIHKEVSFTMKGKNKMS